MKALFLSQRVPYPPDRGDKIPSWRLVERLSRSHEVTIIAFSHDETDLAGAEALRSKGFEVVTIDHDERAKKRSSLPLLFSSTPLTLGVYGSRELQAEVNTADRAAHRDSRRLHAQLKRSLPWCQKRTRRDLLVIN